MFERIAVREYEKMSATTSAHRKLVRTILTDVVHEEDVVVIRTTGSSAVVTD